MAGETQTFAASLRLYLEIESEQQVHDLAEDLATFLVDRGYNHDDRCDAVIACVADSDDVKAWAEGMEPFVASLRSASFLILPSAKAEGD